MDQHSKNNYSQFEGETNQKKIASVHELMEVVDACNLRPNDKSRLETSVRVRSIDNFDDLYRKIEYYRVRNGTVDDVELASVHELMRVVDACNLRDRDKSLLATSVRVRSIGNFDDLYRKIEYYKLRNGTVDNMK